MMDFATKSERLIEKPIVAQAGATVWPRITMVTPVYNGEQYLEATIRSILGQDYPNLEYIVVNDGSTDATTDIIRKYEQHIATRIDQENKGLYAALNAGFDRSSGEIMGWLNASDMLHPKGLFAVASVFRELPQVEWLTGRPTGFNDAGMTAVILDVPRWSRLRFLAGANKYIQQESTFWRRELWERAGNAVSTEFRAEGDFDLWVRFFRHAQLYSVDALIGGYRAHADALSSSNIDRYNANCDLIADRELFSLPDAHAAKLFRKLTRSLQSVRKVRGLWHRTAIKAIYKFPASDWPPVIEHQGDRWVFRGK
jgi:glycosyltransferase involved in cell wall biosynthesis